MSALDTESFALEFTHLSLADHTLSGDLQTSIVVRADANDRHGLARRVRWALVVRAVGLVHRGVAHEGAVVRGA